MFSGCSRRLYPQPFSFKIPKSPLMSTSQFILVVSTSVPQSKLLVGRHPVTNILWEPTSGRGGQRRGWSWSFSSFLQTLLFLEGKEGRILNILSAAWSRAISPPPTSRNVLLQRRFLHASCQIRTEGDSQTVWSPDFAVGIGQKETQFTPLTLSIFDTFEFSGNRWTVWIDGMRSVYSWHRFEQILRQIKLTN